MVIKLYGPDTAFGGDSEDRLSYLPRNVVDCILELLPVEEAARTSILSKNWRYTWASLPNLFLDKLFCQKLAEKSQSVFRETIDMILLQHLGDIVRFSLDVSETQLSSYTDIDRWMLYVTRNGVKELTLTMPIDITHKLPSYIFNCPTLTRLRLCHGVFKPPSSFVGFQNLTYLRLENIKFVPTSEFCVINAPVLVMLMLIRCHDTKYLKIVSPQLVSLVLDFIMVSDKIYVERSAMERLLLSLPMLKEICFGPASLEILSADTVPKGLPFTLDLVCSLFLVIDFGKFNQTSYALQLIKRSFVLRKLEIADFSTSDNEAVAEYMNTPTLLDRPLKKLKHVTIYEFNCSKTLLLFIKLLLAHAPSLVRMIIKPKRTFGSTEARNIAATELMRFPRASPKAELLYLPSVS